MTEATNLTKQSDTPQLFQYIISILIYFFQNYPFEYLTKNN